MIAITFTVTHKLDKDATIQSDGKLDVQPSKWTSNLWPFWIYISIYIIMTLTAFIIFIIVLIKYCQSMMGSSHENYMQTRMAFMNRYLARKIGNDAELQASLYHGNQKMNCNFSILSFTTLLVIASFWFLVVTGATTFVAIMFCYRLGQYLDQPSKTDSKENNN